MVWVGEGWGGAVGGGGGMIITLEAKALKTTAKQILSYVDVIWYFLFGTLQTGSFQHVVQILYNAPFFTRIIHRKHDINKQKTNFQNSDGPASLAIAFQSS